MSLSVKHRPLARAYAVSLSFFAPIIFNRCDD
jgi:hypothetical protein